MDFKYVSFQHRRDSPFTGSYIQKIMLRYNLYGINVVRFIFYLKKYNLRSIGWQVIQLSSPVMRKQKWNVCQDSDSDESLDLHVGTFYFSNSNKENASSEIRYAIMKLIASRKFWVNGSQLKNPDISGAIFS